MSARGEIGFARAARVLTSQPLLLAREKKDEGGKGEGRVEALVVSGNGGWGWRGTGWGGVIFVTSCFLPDRKEFNAIIVMFS